MERETVAGDNITTEKHHAAMAIENPAHGVCVAHTKDWIRLKKSGPTENTESYMDKSNSAARTIQRPIIGRHELRQFSPVVFGPLRIHLKHDLAPHEPPAGDHALRIQSPVRLGIEPIRR